MRCFLTACFVLLPIFELFCSPVSVADPVVITVTSLDDGLLAGASAKIDSTITLRDAIEMANGTTADAPVRIVFHPSLANPGLIRLSRSLPALTRGRIEIDGRIGDVNRTLVRVQLAFRPSTVTEYVAVFKVMSPDNHLTGIVVGGSGGVGAVIEGASASGNRITGCRFGFDPSSRLASQDMQLSYGVVIKGGASGTTVGGARQGDSQHSNYIANCAKAGVFVSGLSIRGTEIAGNYIGGLSLAGTTVPGNGNGVQISSSSGNAVGGVELAKGNVIAWNALNGVIVDGREAANNLISRNSFHDNAMLGIDLSSVGGVGDGPDKFISERVKPSGPNLLVPAPIVRSYKCSAVSASAYSCEMAGSATPGAIVEAYLATPHVSGFGEGTSFLSETAVGPDGRFTIKMGLPSPGAPVTLLCRYQDNTSEFSQTVAVAATGETQVVAEFQAWQNSVLIPVGFTRQVGVEALVANPPGAPIPLTVQLDPAGVARAPAEVAIERTSTVFPVEGVSPGIANMQMRLPAQYGGCWVAARVLTGVPTDCRGLSKFETNQSLDGSQPFRFFAISGKAGDVLNVKASSIGSDEMLPAVIVFNRGVKNLAMNSFFQRTDDSFVQLMLPETGEYFIAVGDMFVRRGAALVFGLSFWIDANGDDPGASFGQRQQVEVQGGVTRAAMGDVDMDGYQDLVSIQKQGQLLQVMIKERAANSKFRPPITRALPFRPSSVALSDMDGDGRPDILVTDADTGGITVFYNSSFWAKAGAGSMFKREKRFASNAGGADLSLTSDFNSDGWSDAATFDSATGDMQVFLNDKTGNLVAFFNMSTGGQPVAAAIADLNSDDIPDIAVADAANGLLALFQGDGSGGFTLASTLEGFSSPADVQCADLDKDGFQDILAVSRSTGVLRTYRGMGTFDFELLQDLSGGTTPSSIALDDINSDGYEDVAVANSGSQNIWIYQGMKMGMLMPVAVLSSSGEVQQVFYTSFGSGGAYFGVAPDQGFVSVFQGGYQQMDFPYAESESDRAAAFAFANPSESDALVYLCLYNPDGTPVADAGVSNPMTMTIPAKRQAAFYVSDVFGVQAENYQPWMRVSSLNPAVIGFSLVVSRTQNLFMDGVTSQSAPSTRFAFPVGTFAGDGTVSRYSLSNPGGSPASARVSCRAATGSALASFTLQIPAYGRSTFSFDERFPGVSESVYLDVSSDKPLEGFHVSGTDQMIAATPGLSPDVSESPLPLYMPHFAEGRVYRSTLVVFNLGSETTNAAITAWDDGGLPLGTVARLAIQPGGFVQSDISALLGIDPQSSEYGTGFFRIDVDRAGLCGALTFSDRQRGVYASTIPLQSASGKRWAFSHLAVGTLGGIDFFTGITMVNVGASDASVVVEVFDSLGQSRGEAPVAVPAGKKIARLLTELIPGISTQSGGYITLTTDSENASLVAFELFGDYGMNFLSAVPAQALR